MLNLVAARATPRCDGPLDEGRGVRSENEEGTGYF